MATLAAHPERCPDVDALMDMARERTGLDDFGDPARKGPLDMFVSSLQTESWARMSAKAKDHAVDHIVHLLGCRLQLIEDRRQDPEIAQQKIDRPMIVVGPPRSGSTLVHTLLSLDPQHLAPEHWVCLEPSPPPKRGAPSQDRLDRAEKRMMGLFDEIPDIFVTHPYMIEEGAGALAECGSDILNMVFLSQQLWCFYRNEDYRRYLLEADHSAPLQFHREFLQHLQAGTTGKRWALKGSDHMLWLGELGTQYPDAMLIWTHRDLAQQLGSLANIQAILCGFTGKPVEGEEREAVGRLAIEHQHAAIMKGIRARDMLGDDRFFDVSYHDVMADPLRTLERIYDRFGLALSDAHVTNVRDWIDRNPQTKHGVHKYSTDEFGLEAGAINRRFQEYADRFGHGYGIRPEPAK